jgi:hypothetical protein
MQNNKRAILSKPKQEVAEEQSKTQMKENAFTDREGKRQTSAN